MIWYAGVFLWGSTHTVGSTLLVSCFSCSHGLPQSEILVAHWSLCCLVCLSLCIELLHETWYERISETVKIDVSKDEILPKESISIQKVTTEEIMPKESIAVQKVVTEERVATELFVQQPTFPEVAEADSSISLPKEEEESAAFQLESVEEVQPVQVEDTIAKPASDAQKFAETTLAEVNAPKPEVGENVSLTVTKQAKPDDVSAEDSFKIPSSKPEEESVSLEMKRPEPQVEDTSLTLKTPKSPTKDEESVSLSLRPPQEEEDTDLTLSLRKPEDGMMAIAALACMPTSSMDQHI